LIEGPGLQPDERDPLVARRPDGTSATAGPAIADLDAELAPELFRAIGRTRDWLLARQHPDGYWVGELEGDTILESEYILLLAYLGRHDSVRASKAARYLLEKQLPTGGWAPYPGGEIEISASVKAYFALKLTGHDPASPAMEKARTAILAAGGADAINSFTRFYLALLGQISYQQCPAVPPELVLLPRWFPVNLYAMSAWSRTIVVPLSIMWACRPTTNIDPALGISELFIRPPDQWPALRCPGQPVNEKLLSWEKFFRVVDRLLKWLDSRGLMLLRKSGLAAAERWMVERFAGSEGLGAIFPPMVWSIVALKCLGYADDSPEMKYCHEHLEGLILEEPDTVRLQPCKSPVWDTAIALRALTAAGTGRDEPAITRAVGWLLLQEVRRRGDWSATVAAEPGDWCFEHANEFYPDVDDTIIVMMALWRRGGVDSTSGLGAPSPRPSPIGRGSRREAAVFAACERARRWVLALQNSDGGWAAFDRNNDREFLCHVPFADHNAMIDPSTPDLTGRTLEALAQMGARPGEPSIDRAIAYLRRTQESDGSWFGRWGVNYIYGTWQTLVGLAEIGVAADDPAIVAAAEWLIRHQQACGGWGESADSYAEPRRRGQGPVTASQTAWALLGLIAAGRARHPAVKRGVQYLVDTQQPDGTWHESEFTGTGFPRVFYLRYHLYPIYFPLLALATWADAVMTTKNEETKRTADDADGRR